MHGIAKGVLQHPNPTQHNATHTAIECIPIHVYFSNPSIYYANFFPCMYFNVSIISHMRAASKGEWISIIFLLLLLITIEMCKCQMANGFFGKTWRVNLFILCTFLYASLHLTALWSRLNLNFQRMPFRLECDYKMANEFFKYTNQMNKSNECIIVCIPNQIKSALPAFSARIDLVHLCFFHGTITECDFHSTGKIEKRIKSSGSFKLCINIYFAAIAEEQSNQK